MAEGRSPATAAPPPEPDGALLRRHLDGDPEAFELLVALHGPAVYGLLRRFGLSPEERDDVFQETFVRIHRAAGSYRAERPLRPWLLTIAANTARNHLGRARGRELPEDRLAAERLVAPEPSGAAFAEGSETAQWLAAELDRLPDGPRRAVVLHCIQGLEQQDVASILEVPLNTVKTHVRRGRLALAGALARRRAALEREVG